MSVKQYIDSMVEACASEIVSVLGDAGPLSAGDIARAVRMEHHVAMAIIERAVNLLKSQRKIVEEEHHDARAREGGACALYSLREVEDAV